MIPVAGDADYIFQLQEKVQKKENDRNGWADRKCGSFTLLIKCNSQFFNQDDACDSKTNFLLMTTQLFPLEETAFVSSIPISPCNHCQKECT